MRDFEDRVRLEMTLSNGGMVMAQMTVDKTAMPAVCQALRDLATQRKAA
jgi:hypothetical protein